MFEKKILYIPDHVVPSDIPKILSYFETFNLAKVYDVIVYEHPEQEYYVEDLDLYCNAVIILEKWYDNTGAESFYNTLLDKKCKIVYDDPKFWDLEFHDRPEEYNDMLLAIGLEDEDEVDEIALENEDHVVENEVKEEVEVKEEENAEFVFVQSTKELTASLMARKRELLRLRQEIVIAINELRDFKEDVEEENVVVDNEYEEDELENEEYYYDDNDNNDNDNDNNDNDNNDQKFYNKLDDKLSKQKSPRRSRRKFNAEMAALKTENTDLKALLIKKNKNYLKNIKRKAQTANWSRRLRPK